MSAPPLVEVEGLSRTYGDRLALDGVSFGVAAGELFALLGPNGGGKTTLFKLLSTLLPPSAGTFRVDGIAPSVSLRDLRSRLGVVFQSPSLDRKLTVLENLLVQGAVLGLGGRPLRARAAEIRVYDSRCPHQVTNIPELAVTGRTLTCPKHEWAFDLATGARRCLSGEFKTGVDAAGNATGGVLAAAGIVRRGAFPSAMVLAAEADIDDEADLLEDALDDLDAATDAGDVEDVIDELEDVIDGLENTPAALVGLLAGENRGKRMVKVA